MNRHAALGWISAAVAAALLLALPASADTFGKVVYDRQNDQLVVTMRYRGTNPNHGFSLKWGPCEPNRADGLPGITAEVLDDQFQDAARQDFKKTTRFDLSGLPCRPVHLTLRSAPRFFYTLTIR
ncbi:MAG: hypothetical protein WBF89_19625 [Steroidobacteraceae bacterium]|jgi:hypothetical protein